MSNSDQNTPRRINRVPRESSRRNAARQNLRAGNYDALESFGPTRAFRTGCEA